MAAGTWLAEAITDDAHGGGAWVARFLGLRNVFEDDGRCTVIRPDAIRLTDGADATVLSAERRGPVVWLRVRTADGRVLEAPTTAADHPRRGAAVGVEIDPAGVVELPGEEQP